MRKMQPSEALVGRRASHLKGVVERLAWRLVSEWICQTPAFQICLRIRALH
jgi:hypothetical protein